MVSWHIIVVSLAASQDVDVRLTCSAGGGEVDASIFKAGARHTREFRVEPGRSATIDMSRSSRVFASIPVANNLSERSRRMRFEYCMIAASGPTAVLTRVFPIRDEDVPELPAVIDISR